MKSSEIAALPLEVRRSMAAREKLKGLTETEIVQAWYVAETPFELTPREDHIRQRLDFAKAQFLKRRKYGRIVEMLMTEFGISIAQARVDIRNMKHLFGDLDEVPKAAHRQRAIQMALKAYNMAAKNDDPDAMARATKVYIEAAQLDKDDDTSIDLDKLMRERMYVEVIDPALRNMMLHLLAQSGGVFDASAMFEEATAAAHKGEFVDYETLKTGHGDDDG